MEKQQLTTQDNLSIYCASRPLNEDEQQAVARLVAEADNAFIPPLSARYSTTQQELSSTTEIDRRASTRPYTDELLTQSFIFAVKTYEKHSEQSRIVGFLSYRPNTKLLGRNTPLSHYVSTIIVNPTFRGRQLAQRMYKELFAIATKAGQTVSTRTWSTNSSHISLLLKQDFRLVKTIPNDRGRGLDTVYYERIPN